MPGGGWQGHGSYSYIRLIKRCQFVVISSVFDYEKFKQFRTTRRFTMYSVETVDKWTKKKRKTGRKGSGALTHDSDRWQTKQGKQLSSQSNRCIRVIAVTTLHHWIGYFEQPLAFGGLFSGLRQLCPFVWVWMLIRNTSFDPRESPALSVEAKSALPSITRSL